LASQRSSHEQWHGEDDEATWGEALRGDVLVGHQHVGRLEAAVADLFRVGMLNGLADRQEQLQPLARRQAVLVTVLGFT
jgi:hypothetical protein